MDKLDIAKDLLAKLNMPARQQGALCCLTLLAMAKLKNETPWSDATNDWIRIHDIIAFIADNYGVNMLKIQEKLSVSKLCTLSERQH